MTGRVWVDLEGTQISALEQAILKHANTLGVILFTRNYSSREQLISLIKEIKFIAGEQILIALDHEGGRIERFPGCFTKIPAPRVFGQLFEHDQELACEQLRIAGNIIANDLLSVGIDLCLAPLLDLDRGISAVLDTRMYHRDAQIVIECARAFIDGLNEYGMQAVGKHFPGHGGCKMDSHLEVAVDSRELMDVLAEDLVPYLALKDRLGAIMLGHLLFNKVDEHIVTMSSTWIQKIYQERLGLNLLTIADCLSMQGIAKFGTTLENAHKCLQAGCDTLIISLQTREDLLEILNSIPITKNHNLHKKIDILRGRRNKFEQPAVLGEVVVN
jgi:beta-N-acetylhexosaminidase